MSPVTHFLAGWVVANLGGLGRRERAAVTGAGVASDIDGLGAIAELLTLESGRRLYWYTEYHHSLAHNIGFGLLVAVACGLVAGRRAKTALLALASFHVHLLGDLAGSRGPDGSQWPIPYLLPFSGAWQWTWQGQWELNAWPNYLITAALLGATVFLAWRRGCSPLEMFSTTADRAFVETLRYRFPRRDARTLVRPPAAPASSEAVAEGAEESGPMGRVDGEKRP